MDELPGPASEKWVPALEIGGTHVTAALVDSELGLVDAEAVCELTLRSEADSDEIVERLVAAASSLRVASGATWGVAIPGPFDYARGIGRFEGVGKFKSLNGFDLAGALFDGLGAAASAVAFMNDADAFLMGEWISGAAKAHRRVVGLTLGTGVGSAFLADGRLIDHGPAVPPDGNIHLLRIGGEPLEDVVSRRAIRARYAESTGTSLDPGFDVVHIFQLARQGDDVASAVIATAFAALGRALAPWLIGFGATVLVVGGSISGSWDMIRLPLAEGLRSFESGLLERVALTLAERPQEAALIGVARHALVTDRSITRAAFEGRARGESDMRGDPWLGE